MNLYILKSPRDVFSLSIHAESLENLINVFGLFSVLSKLKLFRILLIAPHVGEKMYKNTSI